jgi:hypothetical protein
MERPLIANMGEVGGRKGQKTLKKPRKSLPRVFYSCINRPDFKIQEVNVDQE